MGANYKEVYDPSYSIPTPSGFFAQVVYPVGGGTGGETLVSLIPQYNFNSAVLTIVPLGIGAIYNSPTYDFQNSLLNITHAMAFADQVSAASGFKILQSIDGTNWDYDPIPTSVVASTVSAIKAEQYSRYMKIQYTNGGVAQGTFRLGIKFSS